MYNILKVYPHIYIYKKQIGFIFANEKKLNTI